MDDERVSCQLVAAMLKKDGHVVRIANCADEAEACLREAGTDAFECVVTDYQMPGRNGLELLQSLQRNTVELAAIIITAQGEKSVVEGSLRGGASDYLDKPVQGPELRAAVARAVQLTRARRHLRDTQHAAAEMGRMQQQLAGAAGGAGGLPVELFLRARDAAGGDFFNRFQLGPDRYFALLGDVSGHDLKAAFVAAYFQGMLRGMLERGALAAEVFGFFNDYLLNEWNHEVGGASAGAGVSTSVCANAVLVDGAAQTATVLTSGAPLALLVNGDGRARYVGASGSYPLGWFPGNSVNSQTVPATAGSSLLMWSDGVESMAEHLRISPACLATSLLLARRGQRPAVDLTTADDDILVSHVGLAGDANLAAGFLPVLVEQHHGGCGAEIDRLQETWQRNLRFAVPDLDGATEFNVLLSARELLLNALHHGCAGQPDRFAQLGLSYHPGARSFRLFIRDPGPGHNFDVTAHQAVAAEELLDCHRGLIMVGQMASRVVPERKGAHLTLDFLRT